MAKIDNDTVEAMRVAIARFDTEENRAQYRAYLFPRADRVKRVKELDACYRWDLAWASGAVQIVYERYPDALDAHIDTALRKIVKSLGGSA